MRSLNRFLVAIFTVLCLLGAQQGAVLHELSHFAQSDGAYQNKKQDKQDEQPHSRSCDKCAHYAELGGGALPASGWRISIEDSATTVSTAPQQYSPALTVAAYAARAPPAFL